VKQYQITKSADLLNEEGRLKQTGWAKDLLLRYDHRKIKASRFRIKEWDYYCILNESYGAAFTIADNGYLGFVSVTLFDFKEPKEITKTTMTLFPLGSFNMPSTSQEGDVVFQNKTISLKFLRRKEQRIISVDIPSFTKGNSLSGSITLH
jgi:hypothetical protein